MISTTRLRNRVEHIEAQFAADPTKRCPYCKVSPVFLPAKVRTEIAHREDCGHIANLEALALFEVARCGECGGHLSLQPEWWTCDDCGTRHGVTS